MRTTILAATVCIGALLAGCGSGSKTPTTPESAGSTTGVTTPGGNALTRTGPAGTIGAPASGKYNAKKPSVLERIDSGLVKYFTSKGFTGVTAACAGTSPATASCKVTGTSSSGQPSSTVLTVAVNQATGLLKVTRAAFA